MEGIHVHRFRYGFTAWERLAYEGGILPKLKRRPLLFGLVPLFLIGQLLTAVRLVRRYRVAVVHAHWILPQGLIAVLAKMVSGCSTGILCTLHGGDAYGLRGRRFDLIRRWVIRRTNRLTVVSHSLLRDLGKAGADTRRISVVPMGVDLQNRFIPPAARNDTASLLFVGRLVGKKGLRYLIEAFPKILERFADARLTIVGDGPERARLEELVSSLRIEEKVTFMGAVPNTALPELFHQASVFIFPSVVSDDGDREGFGLVLVEAMGCGCAAVVTDLPAMEDIVQNGKTAIVVRQKNPTEIVRAVTSLLSNSEWRSSLACEGRRQALANFDWAVIIPRYQDILGGILAASESDGGSKFLC
jgi:glycosyltransferase involved in cell wall biosynthesis